MKRSLLSTLLALTVSAPLLGCEPEMEAKGPSFAASPASAAVAGGASASVEPAPTAAAPACPCVAAKATATAAPAAGTTVAASTGEAIPAATATAAPAPAPAKGDITGTVAARPAALGGKNIIVYLADGPKEAAPGAPAVVNQRGMAFLPLVTAVPVGGKVAFANSDPFPHNVFSPDGEKFNLGTMPQGGTATRTFERAGVYTILCNLHPNMVAYVVVTPSSFFARADKDGKYTIAGVPAGTYAVKAWGPRLVEQSQSITVGAGSVTADFQLQR